EEGLLGGVAAIQGAHPDPRPCGDLRDRRVGAVHREHLPGGVEDRPVVPAGLRLPPTPAGAGILVSPESAGAAIRLLHLTEHSTPLFLPDKIAPLSRRPSCGRFDSMPLAAPKTFTWSRCPTRCRGRGRCSCGPPPQASRLSRHRFVPGGRHGPGL